MRTRYTLTSAGRALAAATLCALPLTACGSDGDGRSYPTPDNICGITVDSQSLEKLLDDGDELVQDANSFPLSGSYICHMYVDGNDSVVSDANWHESGYTLREHFEYSNIKGVRYFQGGKYASWRSGIATVIPCPGVSDKGDIVDVTLEDMEWDEDSRGLLEKLGPPYFDAYKKELGCPS
ncbi:hypothetical protein ACWDU0_26680 [Streptomyces cellulosae]